MITMTHHSLGTSTSPKKDKSGHLANHKIRQAVLDIASTLDLEETSFKEMQRFVQN